MNDSTGKTSKRREDGTPNSPSVRIKTRSADKKIPGFITGIDTFFKTVNHEAESFAASSNRGLTMRRYVMVKIVTIGISVDTITKRVPGKPKSKPEVRIPIFFPNSVAMTPERPKK